VLEGVVVETPMGAKLDESYFVIGERQVFVQLSSSQGDVTKYGAVPKWRYGEGDV